MNKSDLSYIYFRKSFYGFILGAAFALTFLFLPASFLMTAEAATKLSTPEPYVQGTFTAAWEKVEHASGYEVRVEMTSLGGGKTVTRTISVSTHHADLTLYAADNNVTFAVRAVSSNTSKYSSSAWAQCEEEICPLDSNTVQGYPYVSNGKLYMTDETGLRLSGWKQINDSWYYFDPSGNNYAVTGWNYIDGAWYYFSDTWKMQTGWQAISNQWYYFSTTAGSTGKMATGWTNIGPNSSCYFTENPTDGHPLGSYDAVVTQATYPNSKPPYELTNSGTSSQVSPAPSSGGQLAPQNYWKSNPGGTWSYYKEGNLVKNSWELIDGFNYYFNSSGQMLTGWQYIGGCWYYLEPNANGSNGYKCGAMWKNATTPDGYTVNAEGKWVQNGAVVTDKGSSSGGQFSSGSTSSYGSLKQITKCSISLNITAGTNGSCSSCTVTGATNSTVKNVTYSTSYENWTAGSTVTITVELEPKDNYTYTSSTKFTTSGATVKSHSGSTLHQTVYLSYVPTIKLSAPGCIYINDGDTLMWAPVSKAKRYRLALSGGDLGSKTYTLDEPVFDLNEYGDIHTETVKAVLSAQGASGNSNYTESERVTISDLGSYKESHLLNGSFEQEGSKVRYRDENGDLLTGWQNLCGSWYHFKKNGWSEAPGWYQDTTGYWYYFGGNYQMLTGNVTVNGTTYFLNDGSRGDLPLGAWVQ